jgi:hypothetical protein
MVNVHQNAMALTEVAVLLKLTKAIVTQAYANNEL